MSGRRYSNIIAFDDAPFERDSALEVKIVGTVYADFRLDGIVIGRIKKDGDDAADEIIRLIRDSKFSGHVQLILLQGVTMAGFNVVDVHRLHQETRVPVLIVARKQPDLSGIQRALLEKIADGAQKWSYLQTLGMMEPVAEIYMQRIGIHAQDAGRVIERLAKHSKIPEPLRIAHLIAAALSRGISHGNA